MKLTREVKKEIDKMTPHQICTMFRFHPTNMTTGQTGRYMQDKAREMKEMEAEKKELQDEQKRKVFGVT